MRCLVFSDIHGSLYYTKKIEELIILEKPDKLILLGDLYYHGPRNPLPKEYNPMEVSKILNKYSNLILCTKGNCDAEVDEKISNFQFIESFTLDICNKKFMFTHGHKINIENFPQDIDYLVYGHFHTGFIKTKNGKVFINSGSVSLPKENTPNSYLIIDKSIQLKDFDNNIILEYPIF